MRWAGYVVRVAEMRNARNYFIGQPEGKRPLGRHRRRWKDNIGIVLGEIWLKNVEWLKLRTSGRLLCTW